MTYGEAKEIIRDYGFEDNSAMTEYNTNVKNALNAAIQNIYDDMVIQLKGYYKKTLSTDEVPWEPIRPEYITDSTPDDFVIELRNPDNLFSRISIGNKFLKNWLENLMLFETNIESINHSWDDIIMNTFIGYLNEKGEFH